MARRATTTGAGDGVGKGAGARYYPSSSSRSEIAAQKSSLKPWAGLGLWGQVLEGQGQTRTLAARAPRGREREEQSGGHLPPVPTDPLVRQDPLTYGQQLHGVSEGRVERVLLGHEFRQVLVLRLHLGRGCGRRGQQRGRRGTHHSGVGTCSRGRQQRRRLRGGRSPSAPSGPTSASPGPVGQRRRPRRGLTHRGVDT